jgi:putative phage-type endonuclease
MKNMDNTLIQGTAEWLENRKKFIGASDAPIIMGVSPWKTEYQLFEEKLGFGKEIDLSKNPQIVKGMSLEPLVLEAFNNEYSVKLSPQVVFHKEIKFMMASLDGLSEKKDMAIEIKCPGRDAHQQALNGEIPEYYYPQLQHQLACLDIESIYYRSFNGGSTATVIVKRDDKYIKKMIEKEKKFWDCVLTFTPPELSNKDYVQKTSEEWIENSDRLKEIEHHMKLLEKEKAYIRDILIKECDGQSSTGNGVSISKGIYPGRIDYKKIPELIDVDLEKYRGESKETWVLRFSK